MPEGGNCVLVHRVVVDITNELSDDPLTGMSGLGEIDTAIVE